MSDVSAGNSPWAYESGFLGLQYIAYRLTGQITHERYLETTLRRSLQIMFTECLHQRGWKRSITADGNVELFNYLQLTYPTVDSGFWCEAGMNQAAEVASRGHLHRAPLLPKTETAEGLLQQAHISGDRTPLSKGLQTFDRISLHTTTLERKRRETYLTLSGLAPSPR